MFVPSFPNQNVVGCKWVFIIKKHHDESIDRYKARLVAKGFHQQEGINYKETFSPVAKPQLPGFSDPSFPNHVYKLKKSLYGLQQAPRAWFAKLFQVLHSFGFQQSFSDASLFVLKAPTLVIILVYVDDILVMIPNVTLCQHYIKKMSTVFPVKDLGHLHYFFGLEVHRSSKDIFLHQGKYLLALLQKTKMDGTKPCSTPLSTTKLDHTGAPLSNLTEYRSIVEALQYLTWTRLDISFAVNQACQFMHAPQDSHLQAAKRILRFLKGTLTHALCILLHIRMPIRQGAHLTGGPPVAIILHLWCDDISAISLASNPIFHARTKHVEIDYHYIRELFLAQLIKIQYVCSQDQLADIHTKSLSRKRFLYLQSKLSLGPFDASKFSLKECKETKD
ncbi:unnamed protein product [Malus baccata var. baccata]